MKFVCTQVISFAVFVYCATDALGDPQDTVAPLPRTLRPVQSSNHQKSQDEHWREKRQAMKEGQPIPGLETDTDDPNGIYHSLNELKAMRPGPGVQWRDQMPVAGSYNSTELRRKRNADGTKYRRGRLNASRNLKAGSGEVFRLNSDRGKVAGLNDDHGKVAGLPGDIGKVTGLTGDHGKVASLPGDHEKVIDLKGNSDKEAGHSHGSVTMNDTNNQDDINAINETKSLTKSEPFKRDEGSEQGSLFKARDRNLALKISAFDPNTPTINQLNRSRNVFTIANDTLDEFRLRVKMQDGKVSEKNGHINRSLTTGPRRSLPQKMYTNSSYIPAIGKLQSGEVKSNGEIINSTSKSLYGEKNSRGFSFEAISRAKRRAKNYDADYDDGDDDDDDDDDNEDDGEDDRRKRNAPAKSSLNKANDRTTAPQGEQGKIHILRAEPIRLRKNTTSVAGVHPVHGFVSTQTVVDKSLWLGNEASEATRHKRQTLGLDYEDGDDDDDYYDDNEDDGEDDRRKRNAPAKSSLNKANDRTTAPQGEQGKIHILRAEPIRLRKNTTSVAGVHPVHGFVSTPTVVDKSLWLGNEASEATRHKRQTLGNKDDGDDDDVDQSADDDKPDDDKEDDDNDNEEEQGNIDKENDDKNDDDKQKRETVDDNEGRGGNDDDDDEGDKRKKRSISRVPEKTMARNDREFVGKVARGFHLDKSHMSTSSLDTLPQAKDSNPDLTNLVPSKGRTILDIDLEARLRRSSEVNRRKRNRGRADEDDNDDEDDKNGDDDEGDDDGSEGVDRKRKRSAEGSRRLEKQPEEMLSKIGDAAEPRRGKEWKRSAAMFERTNRSNSSPMVEAHLGQVGANSDDVVGDNTNQKDNLSSPLVKITGDAERNSKQPLAVVDGKVRSKRQSDRDADDKADDDDGDDENGDDKVDDKDDDQDKDDKDNDDRDDDRGDNGDKDDDDDDGDGDSKRKKRSLAVIKLLARPSQTATRNSRSSTAKDVDESFLVNKKRPRAFLHFKNRRQSDPANSKLGRETRMGFNSRLQEIEKGHNNVYAPVGSSGLRFRRQSDDRDDDDESDAIEEEEEDDDDDVEVRSGSDDDEDGGEYDDDDGDDSEDGEENYDRDDDSRGSRYRKSGSKIRKRVTKAPTPAPKPEPGKAQPETPNKVAVAPTTPPASQRKKLPHSTLKELNDKLAKIENDLRRKEAMQKARIAKRSGRAEMDVKRGGDMLRTARDRRKRSSSEAGRSKAYPKSTIKMGVENEPLRKPEIPPSEPKRRQNLRRPATRDEAATVVNNGESYEDLNAAIERHPILLGALPEWGVKLRRMFSEISEALTKLEFEFGGDLQALGASEEGDVTNVEFEGEVPIRRIDRSLKTRRLRREVFKQGGPLSAKTNFKPTSGVKNTRGSPPVDLRKLIQIIRQMSRPSTFQIIHNSTGVRAMAGSETEKPSGESGEHRKAKGGNTMNLKRPAGFGVGSYESPSSHPDLLSKTHGKSWPKSTGQYEAPSVNGKPQYRLRYQKNVHSNAFKEGGDKSKNDFRTGKRSNHTSDINATSVHNPEGPESDRSGGPSSTRKNDSWSSRPKDARAFHEPKTRADNKAKIDRLQYVTVKAVAEIKPFPAKHKLKASLKLGGKYGPRQNSDKGTGQNSFPDRPPPAGEPPKVKKIENPSSATTAWGGRKGGLGRVDFIGDQRRVWYDGFGRKFHMKSPTDFDDEPNQETVGPEVYAGNNDAGARSFHRNRPELGFPFFSARQRFDGNKGEIVSNEQQPILYDEPKDDGNTHKKHDDQIDDSFQFLGNPEVWGDYDRRDAIKSHTSSGLPGKGHVRSSDGDLLGVEVPALPYRLYAKLISDILTIPLTTQGRRKRGARQNVEKREPESRREMQTKREIMQLLKAFPESGLEKSIVDQLRKEDDRESQSNDLTATIMKLDEEDNVPFLDTEDAGDLFTQKNRVRRGGGDFLSREAVARGSSNLIQHRGRDDGAKGDFNIENMYGSKGRTGYINPRDIERTNIHPQERLKTLPFNYKRMAWDSVAESGHMRSRKPRETKRFDEEGRESYPEQDLSVEEEQLDLINSARNINRNFEDDPVYLDAVPKLIAGDVKVSRAAAKVLRTSAGYDGDTKVEALPLPGGASMNLASPILNEETDLRHRRVDSEDAKKNDEEIEEMDVIHYDELLRKRNDVASAEEDENTNENAGNKPTGEDAEREFEEVDSTKSNDDKRDVTQSGDETTPVTKATSTPPTDDFESAVKEANDETLILDAEVNPDIDESLIDVTQSYERAPNDNAGNDAKAPDTEASTDNLETEASQNQNGEKTEEYDTEAEHNYFRRQRRSPKRKGEQAEPGARARTKKPKVFEGDKIEGYKNLMKVNINEKKIGKKIKAEIKGAPKLDATDQFFKSHRPKTKEPVPKTKDYALEEIENEDSDEWTQPDADDETVELKQSKVQEEEGVIEVDDNGKRDEPEDEVAYIEVDSSSKKPETYSWGDWSECSVTCGLGQRFRSNRCQDGLPCTGKSASEEMEVCDVGDC